MTMKGMDKNKINCKIFSRIGWIAANKCGCLPPSFANTSLLLYDEDNDDEDADDGDDDGDYDGDDDGDEDGDDTKAVSCLGGLRAQGRPICFCSNCTYISWH